MNIFLGTVLELATVIGSVAITVNAGLDSILEIPKKGYKINKSVLDEILKKHNEEKRQNTNLADQILGSILLLIPGINLINASIKGIMLKKKVMDDPKIQKYIVPMSEEEKEQYSKMTKKSEKLVFLAFASKKEKEEEFLGFVGGRPLVVNHGLSSLCCEKLKSLNYTLDEVKRLNEATTYSYSIGKMHGKNVAIIGIPNPNSTFSKLQFKNEDYKVTHSYEQMTEEEAQDKTFTVYPFTINDTTKADIEKIIQEISQSHIEETIKNYVAPIFEEEYSSKVQGPQLVKTMHIPNDKQ